MNTRGDHTSDWYFDEDPWPHEPPSELLEALDRAAARLSELDARGVTIALGIGSGGGAVARVSEGNRTHAIAPARLLQLVCEHPAEPLRV